MLHLLVYQEETVDFNVKRENKLHALKMLKHIYSSASSSDLEQIYNYKLKKH